MRVCGVVLCSGTGLAAGIHHPRGVPLTAFFHVATQAAVVRDDVGCRGGDLRSPGVGSIFCGVTIPSVHLESHPLVVMVELQAAAACRGGQQDAGSADFPLIHVFSMQGGGGWKFNIDSVFSDQK